MNYIKILNVKIDNYGLPQIIKILKDFICSGKPHQIATINAEFIVAAQKNALFSNALAGTDLAVCDGIGPFLASRFLNGKIKMRISGVKLSQYLLLLAAKYGYRVFLLGSKPGIAQKATENLKHKIPRLNIVGAVCGGRALDKRDDIAMINAVTGARPDILLVAFGHPKQEIWITRYKHLLDVPVMMGVGGTLDYFAETKKRAPKLFISLGLEWLWRFYQEPKRYRRIFTATIIFPWLCLRSLCKTCIAGKN